MQTPQTRPAPPKFEPPDISEKGAPRGGQPQSSDHRIYMQLFAWGGCTDVQPVIAALDAAKIDAVVYEDLNDPRGIAVLTLSDDPNHFLDTVRPLLNAGPFAALTAKPEYTMFGRSYALGYEPDLEETLYNKPRFRALNPDWPWAIWYPIRRSGKFNQLPEDEQKAILKEHGVIGFAFGRADYAHDIRLASHGLDKNDADFVIGLLGKELFPLSAIVQTMRKTTQTSLYLERLGPFFIGRAVWKRASE